MIKRLIYAAYPHRCPVCDGAMPFFHACDAPDDSPAGSPLAHAACYRRLRFIGEAHCLRCGCALPEEDRDLCLECRRRSFHFEQNIALLTYNDAAQFSLVRFKYYGRQEFARFYVRELLKRDRRQLELLAPEALIPVPVHRTRLARRGYNQAELLCFELSDALGVPVRSDVLRRVRPTRAQKELDSVMRLRNLENAMQVPEGSAAGLRRVLLVDDIYTTGSTLEACTRVLKAAGVREVYCVTVAVGEGH